MATPASSTSSPNSSQRIRIIQEIFNDYNGLANEQALQQLDAALEDRCPIIVIEPRRLADHTCKWINVFNWISTSSVPFGVCSVATALCSRTRWWMAAPASFAAASICTYGFHRFGQTKRWTDVPNRFRIISQSFFLCTAVTAASSWPFCWLLFGAVSGGLYVLHWLSFSPDPCSKYQVETDDAELDKIYREINNQHLPGNNSLVVLVLKEDKNWQLVNDLVFSTVVVTLLVKAAFGASYFLCFL